MKAKDYRKAAWGKLSGNWGTMILIFLIESVLLAVASTLGMGIGELIIGGPITLGVLACTLALVRKEKVEISDMFKGFNKFVESFVLYILIAIFTFLWSLLLIIPGIIAALKYSMAYFILQDNPNMTGNEARLASMEMMNGHKMELFCLFLSYIGWFILGCLTFGLLFFMVVPYYRTAKAEFYENIKGNKVETETKVEVETIAEA